MNMLLNRFIRIGMSISYYIIPRTPLLQPPPPPPATRTSLNPTPSLMHFIVLKTPSFPILKTGIPWAPCKNENTSPLINSQNTDSRYSIVSLWKCAHAYGNGRVKYHLSLSSRRCIRSPKCPQRLSRV